MQQHYRLLSDTKQQYREIFESKRIALNQRLLERRQAYHCQQCSPEIHDDTTWFLKTMHQNCGYRDWQRASLAWIENDLGEEIIRMLQAVENYKNTFNCHLCGMCCRMASTDASYEELKKRAESGDEFARQFTGIFLPYPSQDAARKISPEVVDAVLAEAEAKGSAEGQIHFYHCPYLGEDNRCSVFGTEKRPSICASYPETPLSFVYERCAWKPWKDETHLPTLEAHALTELCMEYASRLKSALLIQENPSED